MPLGLPARQPESAAAPDPVPATLPGLRGPARPDLWPAGEEHARRTLAEFTTYYNQARSHRSLGGDVPVHRDVEKDGVIKATAYLGGLHHGYSRAA